MEQHTRTRKRRASERERERKRTGYTNKKTTARNVYPRRPRRRPAMPHICTRLWATPSLLNGAAWVGGCEVVHTKGVRFFLQTFRRQWLSAPPATSLPWKFVSYMHNIYTRVRFIYLWDYAFCIKTSAPSVHTIMWIYSICAIYPIAVQVYYKIILMTKREHSDEETLYFRARQPHTYARRGSIRPLCMGVCVCERVFVCMCCLFAMDGVVIL